MSNERINTSKIIVAILSTVGFKNSKGRPTNKTKVKKMIPHSMMTNVLFIITDILFTYITNIGKTLERG